MDVSALARAAVQVAGLMTQARPEIASIDINPLMLGDEGSGYAVVDAVIVVWDEPPVSANG